MNIEHLRYVLEVAKCGSISKAAKELYLNQPYLSKVIGDIENELNIRIFERSNRGIRVTGQGQEALSKISSIVREMDELQHLNDEDQSLRFYIAVPTASYISDDFVDFVRRLCQQHSQVDVSYREADTTSVIDLVNSGQCNIGIIRVFDFDRDYYDHLLEFKGLKWEELASFENVILMSENNPAALSDSVSWDDLTHQVAIVHGDLNMPRHSRDYVHDLLKKAEITSRIKVYERATELSLLEKMNNAFAAESPMPASLLEKYHLVTRPLQPEPLVSHDVIISRYGYKFSHEEEILIDSLKKVSEAFL